MIFIAGIGIVAYHVEKEGSTQFGIPTWNYDLAASGILARGYVDAVTMHDYGLNAGVLNSEHPATDWSSIVASFAAASTIHTVELFQPGQVFENHTLWVTEFGILQKHFGNLAYLESIRLGGLRALHEMGRVLEAVQHPAVIEAL